MKTRHGFLNLQQEAEVDATEEPSVEITDQACEPVEDVQSEVLRTHLQLETLIYAYQSHVRRTKALWTLVACLTAGVIGLAWLGYGQYVERSESPATSAELEDRVSELHARIALAELRLSASDRSEAASIPPEATTVAPPEPKAAVPKGVVPEKKAATPDPTQIAALEGQLSDVLQELGTLRSQISSAKPQPPPAPAEQTATRRPETPAPATRRAPTAPASVTEERRAGLQRISFEIPRNRTEQIAPDVYLTIKEANVDSQSVDGWMQLTKEGRIVWIRQHGLTDPLSFVTRQDQRTHQLVFTRIARNAISGYLLVPGAFNGPSITSR